MLEGREKKVKLRKRIIKEAYWNVILIQQIARDREEEGIVGDGNRTGATHPLKNKKNSRERNKGEEKEKEEGRYKRADLIPAIRRVYTTNNEQHSSKELKYLLKVRQNKLLLRGRLKEIGIIQDGECIVCAKKERLFQLYYSHRHGCGFNANHSI